MSRTDNLPDDSHSGTIFWDFDGTLVSRPRMWSAACMEALDVLVPDHSVVVDDLRRGISRGLPWHEPERSYVHITEPDAWWAHVSTHFHDVLHGLGVRTDMERVTNRMRQTITDASRYGVYEDVVPALEGLAEDGWRHVIVSNHVPELAEIVRQLDLNEYFAAVVSSSRVGFEKPNPRIFLHALELAVADRPVWMIGDNVTADCLSVRDLGIDAILVRTDSAAFEPRARDLLVAVDMIRSGRPGQHVRQP
jgi:putative hydrolase of the HAD superfamily